MDLARGIMVRNALKAVLVLLLMLVAGCVGAIEDVVSEKEEVIIDEVLEPFTRMMDWMEVGERQRSSPALMPYDSCEALEEDLRENLKEKMRINMLQQVYYYGGWGWGGGMMSIQRAAPLKKLLDLTLQPLFGGFRSVLVVPAGSPVYQSGVGLLGPIFSSGDHHGHG